MANMSYCRFQNTLHDLRECAEILEEIEAEGGLRKLHDELAELREEIDELDEILDLDAEAHGDARMPADERAAMSGGLVKLCERQRELDELILSEDEHAAMESLLALVASLAEHNL